MPEKKSRKRKEKKGKRVTVKKQVKTRVTVNVKQSSGGGGGGVVAAPYWHPPPISNYVPTTTTLMSAVTSPLTPGNVGETNLANQMAAMQKSIDSLAQAFPAAKAAPSTAEAGTQASTSTAEAGTQASTSSAEAGTQFEDTPDPDPDSDSMKADAPPRQSRKQSFLEQASLARADAGAQTVLQIDTPPRADNKRHRRRDAPDSNPRPHKRRRISDEEPTDMVGDIGPPPPPPKPPGPKPPGFASAPGRVRDARKAQAHQKRVRNVLDTVAYRKDVLADLKATLYREPPHPRPAPAAPVEPPKQWKTKPALKIKLKGFKAPELPPEVVKASKKSKRIVGKRNNNNFVMGIV